MATVNFTKGTSLQHGGETVTVVESVDFDNVLVRSASGHHFQIKVADLVAEQGDRCQLRKEIIDEIRAKKVPKWQAAISPLINKDGRTRADVAAAGALLGVSADAVYDALRRFERSGRTEDLAPPTRNGGRDKSRLGAASDQIIDDCMKVLLSRRQHTKRHFRRKVKAAIEKAGLTISKRTLDDRISKISPETWVKARDGYSEKRRKLSPLRGKHPEIARPFQLVQMDHWTVDAEILSSDRTHAIGRPFATFIIDAMTKGIVGFNLGIDHPGGIPTSLAMISMFTRKDELLRKHGLLDAVSWPFWGKPDEIGTDNGSDFTGVMFRTGCENYNIVLTHRPIGAPQYGAFIERLNLSFATWAKDLPGATGSNAAERKKLRPEMTAAFTVDDLEKHIILLIDEYHDTKNNHGFSPRQAYHNYYFDADGTQKHPLPAARVDDLDLRTDWYPIEYRTVQRYGIMIDHLEYYGEEMSSLVTNRVKGQKLEVRRNPYDVTEVYIRHPDPRNGRWMTIPCTTISYPRISIFEHDALVRAQKALEREITPMSLSEHFYAQQRHIEEAVKLTKTAQRQKARREQHDETRRKKPVTSKHSVVGAAGAQDAPASSPFGNGGPNGLVTDSPWVVPPEMTAEYLLEQLDV